jgi:Zn-dependent protease with chaperone function
MPNKYIAVSDAFKKMATRAILSIALFFITYMLLILLAVGLTILCGIAGISLIAFKPMFITFMVGAGLISMGILVLVFLVKFIFKRHIADRAHLIEISKEQEPELFGFIGEIVKQVKTDFPKRIYLSADVNASVFYDSSFWSMILPVRKNLQIGMGLVNSVSASEFKAILAHEFGHFSQRTMKVGSYVYNVNQIIYNLLYDNDAYNSLAQKWAGISGYFSFFVGLAVKTIEGIQWVLKGVYQVVNLSYLGLSREMEFHADEVAAHVAGSQPLITSLLRLDLANHSYNTVLDYYQDKISDAIKAHNIFPQQQYVMNFLAREYKYPVENNLPQLSLDHLSRYNRSKLNIKDQWASHPSTEDRINRLKELNIETEEKVAKAAATLFGNMEAVQTQLTQKLFSQVTYSAPTSYQDDQQFFEEFTRRHQENSFNEIFNTYYDTKSPGQVNLEASSVSTPDASTSINSLFNNNALDLIDTALSLESDISSLNHIRNGELKIKSFDYDGIKYSSDDCYLLILKLTEELQTTREAISSHDEKIYQYFLTLAVGQDKVDLLKSHYQTFLDQDRTYEGKFSLYLKLVNQTRFVLQDTPFEVIGENLSSLKHTETAFKTEIRKLLNEAVYQPELTTEIKEDFTRYLSKDWTYFHQADYDHEALQRLFSSINHYQSVFNKTFFRVKKALLECEAQLEIAKVPAITADLGKAVDA